MSTQASSQKSLSRMPALFIGHGSPMNAIQKNDFTEMLTALGRKIQKPKAILCISAHWMTEGTWITHMQNPKTIHDFYGFPEELFAVQYPAHADLKLADQIRAMVKQPSINADTEMWGYDHGTWSVLRHLYPDANVPLLQLSVYMEQPGEYHFQLGQQLSALRDQGVLIIGSGNLVHNLRKISWETHAPAYSWAVECDEWMKHKLEARDFSALVNDATQSEAGKLSIPTADHYYPFLYVIGSARSDDVMKFEYEGIHHASISMRCVSFG